MRKFSAVVVGISVVCVNDNGDVKLKIVANSAALDGLGTAVNAFGTTAGSVLGLSCSVQSK